jgi:hypothetical protein
MSAACNYQTEWFVRLKVQVHATADIAMQRRPRIKVESSTRIGYVRVTRV